MTIPITLPTLLLVFVTVCLGGCSLFVSEDSLGRSWTGESGQSLITQWGEPDEIRPGEEGDRELIYRLFNGKCIYHFYISRGGVISGYRYNSSPLGTCKPIG